MGYLSALLDLWDGSMGTALCEDEGMWFVIKSLTPPVLLYNSDCFISWNQAKKQLWEFYSLMPLMCDCDDLLLDNMLLRPNDNQSCHCTPRCERNIYRATVSHADVSKAMLRAVPVRLVASSYSQSASANRLEDYFIMSNTNSSWAKRLYQLSKFYSDSRENIFAISTKTLVSSSEINQRNLEQPTKTCLFRSLDLLNGSILQFSEWERNTYYLNYSATLRYENFISRMTNDIVRGLGKLDGFVTGFIHHLQSIRVAADELSTCNETYWYTLSQDILNVTKQANHSISAYYNEFMLLSQDVKTNEQMMSYKIPVDETVGEYVR